MCAIITWGFNDREQPHTVKLPVRQCQGRGDNCVNETVSVLSSRGRLKRCMLLDGDNIKIIREILLSNCGEVELSGDIPKDDEYYLKEFYNDKIYFSKR